MNKIYENISLALLFVTLLFVIFILYTNYDYSKGSNTIKVNDTMQLTFELKNDSIITNSYNTTWICFSGLNFTTNFTTNYNLKTMSIFTNNGTKIECKEVKK